MKKVFFNTNELDKNAINLGLSELILQENAANAIAKCIKKNFKFKEIFAFCGSGNNASDALAALRILSGDFKCSAILLNKNLNQNATIQLQIAKNSNVQIIDVEEFFFIKRENICIIDGIFGSGLNKKINEQISNIIQKINLMPALKIAVDIPSGLDLYGNANEICIKADFTITMGAYKLALFSDFAKDFVGKIIRADLGLCKNVFYSNFQSDFLLDVKDLVLPNRIKQNVNKGDFGHAFVVLGELEGAGELSALAALNMGSGKVSVVGSNTKLNPMLMQKNNINGASAVALGMGLGKKEINYEEFLPYYLVVDADMFYNKHIIEFAKSKKAVLTPHPKEFANLLKIVDSSEYDMKMVLKNKFDLARKFSKNFASTLVLKGANTIIAQNGILYICNQGSAKLATAGSGDVLAGMILGYLAQGFLPLNSAINAVLAQAKIAKNYAKNDFSYNANDMIKGIKCL